MRKSGFSLVELLVVIVVIAILSGGVLVVANNIRDKAKTLAAGQRMANIVAALSAYGSGDGGAATALSAQVAKLGLPGRFAPLPQIFSLVERGGASRNWPPAILDGSGNAMDRTVVMDVTATVNSGKRTSYVTLQGTIEAAKEPIPAATGPIAATWWESIWPPNWPLTTWDLSTPGALPPVLRFPWGQPGISSNSAGFRLTDPTTAASVTNSWATMGAGGLNVSAFSMSVAEQAARCYLTRSDGSAVAFNAAAPLPFDAGQMSPLATIELLIASGILPTDGTGAAAYRGDRSSSQPWNDPWGQPMVVSFSAFIPERYRNHATNQNQRAMLLDMATARYGRNRSLYVIVGAPGPRMSTTEVATAGAWANWPAAWPSADDAQVLRGLWRQIRTVCKAHEWTENGWTMRPWKGPRLGKSGSLTCILSEPAEIR